MTSEDTVPNLMGRQAHQETIALRRAILEREAESDRTWLTFKWGFIALYVMSSTISQVTVAILLNYLVAASN